MLRPTLALARSCHPEPVLVVSALAGLLSLSVGRGLGSLWMVAAVLAGQLSVGWTNDYLDRDLDRRQGRADKPLAAGLISPRAVALAAALALAACLPLSLASGLPSAVAHLAAVGCAMAYNAGLKLTAASVVPYAIAFSLLPATITLAPPLHHLPPAWATAGAALFGSGAHFTQVLPDIGADRSVGIRGLPQRLGERRSALAAAILLLASVCLITLGPAGRPPLLELIALALSAVLTGGILLAAARDRPRLAFRLTLAVAALAGGAFLLSGRSL